METTSLSPNFQLYEFTRSQTAARLGREIAPGAVVTANLQRLCNGVLQPLRESLGPVHVTSGYRPGWLNVLIGGAPGSQHELGLAADLVVPGHSPWAVARWIESSGLPFDQVIHEFGQWCHVSVAALGAAPRREALTAFKDKDHTGRLVTRYAPGIRTIGELAA